MIPCAVGSHDLWDPMCHGIRCVVGSHVLGTIRISRRGQRKEAAAPPKMRNLMMVRTMSLSAYLAIRDATSQASSITPA